MYNFLMFKEAVQQQFAKMTEEGAKLFIVDIGKDFLWKSYLDSFPEGTNEIYKTHREFDCQCCRQFIRTVGNVVAIKDNKLISIWDGAVEYPFDEVSKNMSRLVKTAKVQDVFLTHERAAGTDRNHQQLEDGSAQTWEHFYLRLPSSTHLSDGKSVASVMGIHRDAKNTFKRAMEELTVDSAQTVLELTQQGSLYRGNEFIPMINSFLEAKRAYADVPVDQQDNWCWVNAQYANVAHIRNSAIGTLLVNLSDGMEVDTAVKKYEVVVAPANYKRPTAIITQRMIADAQKTITELGYLESLGRRHAVLDDITMNNVLFMNRYAKKTGSTVFDELSGDTALSPKILFKFEEVTVDKFIADILPSCTTVQVMLENRHQGNMVTLIAPQDAEAPTMFKWDNNFSWSYAGDVTDSMKQRVKAAGGKVDGVLRFSIQWNDDGRNNSDFDAHCVEPGGNRIYYGNKDHHSTTGNLDVDIISPNGKIAVENITWSDLRAMEEGTYLFQVHNYSHRGTGTGFTAEIEYEGDVYTYSYSRELRQDEKVTVAKLNFSKTTGITFIEALNSTLVTKDIWGLKTNFFVDVASIMLSPNYWDGADGSGNKHYMFFLNGCINKDNPRGFYNEFLNGRLAKHKRVFEALGSKMRVEYSQNQLSGIGFSDTQRNSVIAKITGAFSRVIRITF